MSIFNIPILAPKIINSSLIINYAFNVSSTTGNCISNIIKLADIQNIKKIL